MRTPGFDDTMIRASAGSGKTWRLGNRYIGLLAAGVGPENIVAATFSRKAAGEILERILTRLARASLGADAGARLGAEIGDQRVTSETAGELLRSLAGNLHRLRVCTLDSFFGDVARGFGPELGLPPGWEMAEDDDTDRLRAEAIDSALRECDVKVLLEMLDDLDDGAADRSVISSFDEVIKALHAVYCESDADAWGAIVGEGRLDRDALDAQAAGLRATPLPNGHFREPREKVLGALERSDWVALATNGLLKSQAAGEGYYGKNFEAPGVTACARLIGHARTEILAALARRTSGARRMLDVFDVRYREVQRRRKLLRFDDVARVIGEGELATRMEEVFLRLDSRTEHLLLDEFQDTSPSQWRVLLPFARTAIGEGSLFVVGDVKQAIYGWRGGVAEIFDEVNQVFPGVKSEPLDRSQRSSPVVIEVVNKVFGAIGSVGALRDFPDAGGRWAEGFRPHTTAREGFRGYVELRTAPLPDEGVKTDEATLSYAAGFIDDLAARHPGCSVGVLVRENDAVTALTDLLRARGVSASGEGTSPLTSSLAVAAVLSLLRFADHPGHTIARYHVANSPLGAVAGLARDARQSAIQRVSTGLRRALVADGYGACLYRWTAALAPSCDARDLRRLLKLVELGYEYDRDATLRPTDFVAWVEKKRVPDAEKAVVRVMNVHQSKGLQFDIVVLPQLDVLFPKALKVAVRRASPLAPITGVSLPGNKDQIEYTPLAETCHANQSASVVESLNLLYVALTRSVHAIHMIVAPEKEKIEAAKNEPPKGKSKAAKPKAERPKNRLMMAEILCEALAPGVALAPDARLFEHGDASWFTPSAPSVDADAAPEPLRVVLKTSTRPRRHERQSPSTHAESGAGLSAALARPNRVALDQGTLVHAFFERVEWIEDGLPERAALLRLARASGLSAEDSERKVKWFEGMLGMPDVRGAMTRGRYPVDAGVVLEVRREFPFTQRERDAMVNGVIDRLVLHRRDGRTVAAEVIDFKTDGVSAGEAAVASRVEVHRPQMEAYRKAVSRMEKVPLDRVRARLLFVTAGIVRDL